MHSNQGKYSEASSLLAKVENDVQNGGSERSAHNQLELNKLNVKIERKEISPQFI